MTLGKRLVDSHRLDLKDLSRDQKSRTTRHYDDISTFFC